MLKYGKLLENSSQLPAGLSTKAGGDWVVTEKVHGANFSFHVDRAAWVRVGKRTAFLKADEDFFGHHSIVVELRETIQAVAMELMGADEDICVIVFYGELFGGYYPSSATEDNNDTKQQTSTTTTTARSSESTTMRPVQKGVWYSPQKHFILFDIAISYDDDDDDDQTRAKFLPHKQTVEIAQSGGILHAEPLFVGPFHKAINYNPKFNTTIPARLGLRAPMIKGNLAEGIVVKQWDSPYQIPTNNNEKATQRPSFKIKIAEFAEGDSGSSSAPPISHQDQAFRDWIKSLINHNRIAAAASKVGDPTITANQQPIVDLVLEDIRSEVGDDDDDTVQAMENELICIIYEYLRTS